MEWTDVWKIILCAVGSAGGIGAIIVFAVKFGVNTISERLAQKYELKLQKELEQYKFHLDGKNHISKTQYDTEFKIYQSLSKTFFEMIVSLNTIFSSDYRIEKPLDKAGVEEIGRTFLNAAGKAQAAQDCLYENGAFISKTLYEKYEELLERATSVFWEYKESLNKETIITQATNDDWLDEKHKTLQEVEKLFWEINLELRTYLQSLTIIE